MCPKKYWPWRFIVKSLILAFIAPVSTLAQPAPRSVTVASNPPGTVFYALASGLAKIASDGAPFQMAASPIPARALFCLCWTRVRSISASTTRSTWRSPIKDPNG